MSGKFSEGWKTQNQIGCLFGSSVKWKQGCVISRAVGSGFESRSGYTFCPFLLF